MNRMIKTRKILCVLLTAAMVFGLISTALASAVDVAVVDVTAPTGSVTLQPGDSDSITIDISVTGKQDGTATFEVYRDWTLSGGSFTGSNPQEFTVDQRAAQDDKDTFSTNGTVTVAPGQGAGTFTLVVGAFDITNSNTTGAKLSAGVPSSYQVTVEIPAPPSDTTPPAVNITEAPGTWINTTSAYFAWEGSDNISSESALVYSYKLDGCDWSAYSASTSYTWNDLTEGNHTFDVRAKDEAGNVSDVDSVAFGVDLTDPELTWGVATPSPNGAGWNNTDVSIPYSTSDNLSGVASSTPASPLTIDEEGQAVTGNVTVTDNAGNSKNFTAPSVNIDKTDPIVTIMVPANSATYLLNQSVNAAWSAEDVLSGIAVTNATAEDGSPIDTGSVGVKSFTVTATDFADNVKTITVNYNVIYDFNGFFQPVENLPELNAVKAGSAVPVKFSLNGNQGLSIFASGYPKSQQFNCDSNTPVDNTIIETVTAGASSLSYDAAADQYVYVWKTDKSWAGLCRQLVVRLNDGTQHCVNFKLLK